MKKLIPLLITLAAMTSCVTERKRLKICANCPTKIETIVRDSIVRKDSTIRIQGETITEYIRIECPDGAKPTVITKSKSGKRGRVETKMVDPNALKIDCIIDSAAVAFSWNEMHRTVTTEKVLPSEVNCYDWKDMIGAVVLSLVACGIFGAWLVWGKRSKSNKNE
jgi:hypothetical protein